MNMTKIAAKESERQEIVFKNICNDVEVTEAGSDVNKEIASPRSYYRPQLGPQIGR